jgi:hypothetical protein
MPVGGGAAATLRVCSSRIAPMRTAIERYNSVRLFHNYSPLRFDTRFAFSHRLKDKPKQFLDSPSEMTPDQIKVAEKAYRDASLWMFNLSVAIRGPSPKQAEMMNEWLDELTEKIENIRYKLR